MGEYTLELREVVKVCDVAGLALSDYPIWDETHRAALNGKIIDHYWYHEIAHETADQFIRRLRTKMAEIMPYYCEYAKTLPNADIMMGDVDVTVASDGRATNKSGLDSRTTTRDESSQESASSTDTGSKTRAVNSEAPQSRLAGNADYATSAVDTNSSGDSRATGTQKNTGTGDNRTNTASTGEDETHNITRTTGRGRPAAELIAAWRATIANIDMMIIGELDGLFLSVWGLDSTFTDRYPTYW